VQVIRVLDEVDIDVGDVALPEQVAREVPLASRRSVRFQALEQGRTRPYHAAMIWLRAVLA